MVAARNKQYYVNNKQLYEELKVYGTQTPETRVISNYIGDAIMKICTRLSLKKNFIGYTYRDEMVDDAIENCVNAVKYFNPAKTNNPFSYFTTVAWNAFIHRINFEQKETYIKHKNYQNLGLFADNRGASSGNELSDKVIENYERKLADNKKKKKEKGLLNLAAKAAEAAAAN